MRIMLLELLRVIAGILTDVAQAYTNAMESRARHHADRDEGHEDDDTTVWCKNCLLRTPKTSEGLLSQGCFQSAGIYVRSNHAFPDGGPRMKGIRGSETVFPGAPE